MRPLIVLLPLLAGCAPVAPPEAEAADAPPVAPGAHGTFTDEPLTVGKQKRVYRLVVPKSVDLSRPAPLLIAFHGMGIDGKDLMPKYTKLDDLAAEKKFILAYPAAERHAWGLAPEKVKADLAFFDELLRALRAQYRIDPDRVFVTGMSNGGYFAHLVGKERSKTVAAVIAHSTALGLQTLPGIKAERKFPVMIVHGDRDKLISIDFARENRDKYKKEGHEVVYVEVAGLGHIWATEQKINEQIWDFMAKHPRK